MDNDERKRLYQQAFLRHLEGQLVANQQQYPTLVTPSLVSDVGLHVDGPFAANRNAKQDLWRRAEKGVAGTGAQISNLHGAAHRSAAEAHVGGGTIKSGGSGQAGAPENLRRAGMRATGTSLLGWGAIIGCEVALQVGPPLIASIWRAHRDAREADRTKPEREEN